LVATGYSTAQSARCATITQRKRPARALEIDGVSVTLDALRILGIVLSQPPMAAPILMQHTLGYLFTAKPQERSLYFKALLEVSDLDTVRSKIAERETILTVPDSVQLSKLRKCAAITGLASALQPLLEIKTTAPKVDAALLGAATILLRAANMEVPKTQPERLASLVQLLAARRSRTFPLQYFDAKGLPPWRSPGPENLVGPTGLRLQCRPVLPWKYVLNRSSFLPQSLTVQLGSWWRARWEVVRASVC
jgi:hypothetical protein